MTIFYNYSVTPISDKTVEFEWRDSSTNLPVDLSSYMAKMYIWTKKGADIPIKTYSSLDGGVVIDYQNSLIIVRVFPYDLQTYGPGNLWYELFLTNIDTNYSICFAHGFLTLTKYIPVPPEAQFESIVSIKTTVIGTMQ